MTGPHAVAIIYSGAESQARGDATAVPLDRFDTLLADFDTPSPAPASDTER